MEATLPLETAQGKDTKLPLVVGGVMGGVISLLLLLTIILILVVVAARKTAKDREHNSESPTNHFVGFNG